MDLYPLHAIEGYAQGILTVGPSSGVNQYGGVFDAAVEAVFWYGYAAAAAAASTVTAALKP